MTHKIFFASDVHGATAVWKKWLKAPAIYGADILMLCGDLTGKQLSYIVREDDKYHLTFFDHELIISSEEDLALKIKALSDAGFYVHLGNGKDKKSLSNEPNSLNSLFNQKIVERLQQWLTELIKSIDVGQIRTFIMPGNDDHYVVDDILHSYEPLGLRWCIDKVIDIDGIEMISLPYTNPTPWNTPRELSESELKDKIDAQVMKLRNPHKAIFNFHCPPYGTQIDLAPGLDKNMKPRMNSGGVEYIHVGSKAVRKAIEKYQPMLCLHGHIHESPGIEKIGKTLCINPGSEYQTGVLKGYIVEISPEGVHNYWKVEG